MRRASGMLLSRQTTGTTLKASTLRAALQTYPPNTSKSPYRAVQAASLCQDTSRSTAADQQQQQHDFREWPAGAGPDVQARGRRRRAQLAHDDYPLNSIKAARASLDAAWHQEACVNHHDHEACQGQQPTGAASGDSLVGERSRRRSRRSRQASRGYDRSNHGDAGCNEGSSRVGGNRKRWTRLHDQLLHTLRQQEQLLPRHASVLVAVSGGQDSMAMLRMLHDLSQKHWPLRLVVGHCDHRVRPDSAENAEHVRAAASGVLALPYMQVQADRQPGHWAEAAARDWRHQQLFRMAAEAGCGFIALGHTATERAETVLFNMIRGAGTTGLGAMSWSRDLPDGVKLVRPLLGFTRENTLHVCEATGTQIYPDTTNTDQRYMRNRLRLSVFPLLQSINPAAVTHICNTADIVKQESDLMNGLARQELSAALVPCHVVQAPLPQPQRGEITAEGALVGGLHAAANFPVKHQGTARAAQSTAAAAAKAGGSGSSSAGTAALTAAGRRGRPSAQVAAGDTGGAAGVAFCASYSAGLATVPWQLQQHSAAAAQIGPYINQVFGQQADTSLQQQALDSKPHPIQPTPSQQKEEQQQQQQSGQQDNSLYLGGLRVPVLAQQHPALQRRVVQLWLSQQTSRSVGFTPVAEVLQLLRSGVGTGARTSTLWGSSCVLRYKQLLLLLDAATVQQVLSGQLQVGCVTVDAAGLQGLAAWVHTQQQAGKHSVARAVITEGQ